MVHVAIIVVVVLLTTLSTVEPIVVTFGTNQGPIVPPPPPSSSSSSTKSSSSQSPVQNPAPVSEQFDDVPNPSTYRPLIPHQYRMKLLAHRPPSNLIFGTPIDQKYTPALEKFDMYRKQQQQRSIGVDYRGPQVFGRQPYEIAEALKKSTKLQPSVRYIKSHHYDGKVAAQQGQYVPQIGVIYSAGVRYYVPQVNYYQDDQENSVYDQNDQKYVHQQHQ